MKIWIKAMAAAIAMAAVFALAVVSFPQPLFAYSVRHGAFRVRSDRPIDPKIAGVLDEAGRRLRRSDLHDPRAAFRIFICNEPWRLWLYTRSFDIGGSTDTLLTRNIYLREADIAAGRLMPPPPHREIADEDTRTLSYFIAHEATHVMQSRTFGRAMEWRYPDWLTEGYADVIAKAGDFDVEENRALFRQGDIRLDPSRSGLYRRHHLLVAVLLSRPGVRIRDIFAEPPNEKLLSRALHGSE